MSRHLATRANGGRHGGGGVVRAIRSAEIVQAFAFWLFAWSALGAPALHLTNHRHDHVHTPAGVKAFAFRRPRGTPAPTAHAHADGRLHVHGAGDPAAARSARSGGSTDVAVDADDGGASLPPHGGGGSAEHLGVSLLDAAAFRVPALPELVRRLQVAAPPQRLVAARPGAAHRPRGPPALPTVPDARA